MISAGPPGVIATVMEEENSTTPSLAAMSQCKTAEAR